MSSVTSTPPSSSSPSWNLLCAFKSSLSASSAYHEYRPPKFQTKDISSVNKALANSSTLYVGNLSFYTTEEQILELFSKCGEIKRIIMGLDRLNKTPCGFCFVEYYTHEDAQDCVNYINGTRLDDRVIRTDWDTGFEEGRQYGRGKNGGQVRDEYRNDYDPGRGGYGKQRREAGKGQHVSPNPSPSPSPLMFPQSIPNAPFVRIHGLPGLNGGQGLMGPGPMMGGTHVPQLSHNRNHSNSNQRKRKAEEIAEPNSPEKNPRFRENNSDEEEENNEEQQNEDVDITN